MFDVIIIGAGAAGLMCAIEAGKRGRKTLVIDHAKNPAEKIRISGGGRCNFTNLGTRPENFLSSNPGFCISALKRFTQFDFIKLVEKHNIAYHEKTLGQLFCDGSSKQIIDMLLAECHAGGVEIWLDTEVEGIEKDDDGFEVKTNSISKNETLQCTSLVIATGGPSIPKMGSTGFGYQIAKQFGIEVILPRPALVPFTLGEDLLMHFKTLSGLSLDVEVTCNKKKFREGLLFTHRGLSGPAILQISSYWNLGDKIIINFTPGIDMLAQLKLQKTQHPKKDLATCLGEFIPKRLAALICEMARIDGRLADLSHQKLAIIAAQLQHHEISPNGTEGYRTAEVTIGGVDTKEISSSNFEAKQIPGLYFIGEVLDVTGHLGGYNFQWAWSSGFAAGQVV